jgi:hypothetical protein
MPPAKVRQRSGATSFHNSTELDTARLKRMCLDAVVGWRLDRLTVRVRYSRGADFSGTCYYRPAAIYVNLGRHLTYPYRLTTHLARAKSTARHWWKPIYTVELNDAYCVVLFVFLHECYHLLVKRARRNTRQKESMCDRFAARFLVDHCGSVVRDESGRPAPRQAWDFQDVEAFVAAARRDVKTRPLARQAARRAVKETDLTPEQSGNQLLLFDL